jgi:dihydroorotate dehydrogenase
MGNGYKYVAKPLFFHVNPEVMHESMTFIGEQLGYRSFPTSLFSSIFSTSIPSLEQDYFKIYFKNPVGLAAGFDYGARLTQITPSIGFGFQTVGTITNKPYSGNPRPLLGRLPHSQSLMVNKGFKNEGAKAVIKKLKKKTFSIPIGISIGRTNDPDLTVKESIQDILLSFASFERAKLSHSYYELNISCPNLFGSMSFYPLHNLKALLQEIDSLHIQKPIFIKMPISETDQHTLAMLDTISNHSPKGIIIGNLQKDRLAKELVPSEVALYKYGSFSGKPTFQRSNELIALSYKHFGRRFLIIGCGGIFTPQDAYLKIKLGASLLQLITGMIYKGPQVITQINYGLHALIEKDGFRHIEEAIGSDIK